MKEKYYFCRNNYNTPKHENSIPYSNKHNDIQLS